MYQIIDGPGGQVLEEAEELYRLEKLLPHVRKSYPKAIINNPSIEEESEGFTIVDDQGEEIKVIEPENEFGNDLDDMFGDNEDLRFEDI